MNTGVHWNMLKVSYQHIQLITKSVQSSEAVA